MTAPSEPPGRAMRELDREFAGIDALHPSAGVGSAARLGHDAVMEAPDGLEIVSAADRDEWRAWLASHHDTARGAWLVMQKKASAEPGVTYDEAVEEALAFGWIDSRANRIDELRYRQLFSPRRPKSRWAASNKARVERLTAEGRMTPAGLALVEAAKADGSWDAGGREETS